MSSRPGDAWIDDELKNVAVPADLLPKLHAIASLDDAELDRALGDVPMPAGLLDRLRSIGSLDQVDLDDELRHVLAPITLADRLRRIPAVVRRAAPARSLLRPLAIAASLLVAAGIGYLAAISPSLFDQPRQPAERSTVAVTPERTDQGVQPATSSGRPDDNRTDLANTSPPPQPPGGGVPVEPRTADPPTTAPPHLAGLPQPAERSRADVANPDVRDIDHVLGAELAADRLPPLESMPPPSWRGVSPPRERGYDLMFQLRHGVHPFVSPTASPTLAICQVPLVTSSASFEHALQLAAERRLPAGHEIRTEEFLSAMDYGFALPERRPVGIRTAIGPSPWGTPGLSLLQVAAQAKELPRAGGSSHLVAILDASASMRWEGRWETALLGLRSYVEQMRPADRLSLVLMGGKAEIIGERLSRDEAFEALKTLPDQPSARALHAADAVRMASDAAGRGLSDGPGRIVLVTDGLELDEAVNEQVESVLQRAASDGYRFTVLDVRHEETIDTQLNRLAAAAANGDRSGVVMRTPAASYIGWQLIEMAAGKSQLVAAEATMKVTFNPAAVAMYRLLGHEASSVAGLINATVETDLRSGEAATGLFEVTLKPDGGETIATVEVTWRDPTSGAVQTARQTVSRLQIAPSFHQAPLSLQMGALAAETAEVLRNSYFAPPNSHSLANVTELSGQLNPRLRERPSFVKLMRLVEQAQRAQATQ